MIQKDLYELQINQHNEPILTEVSESKLLFNYHYKNTPKIATIWVVTKDGFETFIDKMLSAEEEMAQDMVNAISENIKA